MAKGKKTGGRTKGAINKTTKEAKKRIEFVLRLLDKTLNKDIKALDSIERVRLWSSLQEFVIPKLARTELTGKDGGDITMTISETTNYSLKTKK
ncbi:MAG: hypothetical protein V4549_06605 [Bacteroidota bacterium]